MQGNQAEDGDLYPVLRRRALLDGIVTIGLAAAAGLAASSEWTLGPAAVPRSASVPIALAVAAGPSLSEHRKSDLGIANRLTLFRAVLVGLLAAFIAEPAAEAVSPMLVGLAVAAFGLDWLDGRVARARGTDSPFGARLDMELDAITMVVLCLLAWQLNRAGPWVLLGGGLRYLFVGAGWVWPWLAADLPPRMRRPVACGVGVTCLIACLWPLPVAGLSTLLAAVGVGVLTASFAVDIAWLWRQGS